MAQVDHLCGYGDNASPPQRTNGGAPPLYYHKYSLIPTGPLIHSESVFAHSETASTHEKCKGRALREESNTQRTNPRSENTCSRMRSV